MFKVGDTVQAYNALNAEDQGFVSTIRLVAAHVEDYPYITEDVPPSGEPVFSAAELALVEAAPIPTGKDYHLGYAAGHTHNPRYAASNPGFSPDYRSGFLDGLKQQHAEQIAEAEALFA